MLNPQSKLVTTAVLIALAVLATVVFSVVVVRSAPHSPAVHNPKPYVPEFTLTASDAAGVRVTLEQNGTTVQRTLPAASFGIAEGESLHRAIAPGPFDAIVEVVFRPGPGRARLGVELLGAQVQLDYRGNILLADAAGATPRLALTTLPVDLPRDQISLRYLLRVTGDGPVAFRAVWQPESSLVPLPLPVSGTVLLDDPALRGREQFTALGCVNCHEASGDGRFARVQAPVLGDVGARVDPGWIARWLAGPEAVKPGTTMPHLALDAGTIDDLTHYLVSLGGPLAPETAAPDDALVRTGEKLYHQVGCFACHGPHVAPDPAAGATGPLWKTYAGLGPLGEKTTVTALAAFLRAPHDARPHGRMPDLALAPLEATAIASYLIARNGDAPARTSAPASTFTIDPARVARGRAAFGTAGCANCHELGPNRTAVTTRRAAPSLASIVGQPDGGCLADPPVAGVPTYTIPASTRRDLAAFLHDLETPGHDNVPLDDLLVDFRLMNCSACHAFHAEQGPEAAVSGHFVTEGEADLGDEGRLPPTLSDAGSRLTMSWLHDVLEGDTRARPYLAARMPHFGAENVAGFARGFQAAAGAAALVTEEPPFTIDRATAGRTLVGSSAFNCIQCHTIAGHDATGTPGPDLALMPGRLTYESFSQWLHDPAKLRPGTRMPSLFVGGYSAFTDVLGGAATPQVEAVWSYLSQGEQLALPEGLIDPTGFELVVGAEPVVFRTFMKSAGVRAIACGFPEQIHAAFDADNCRLAAVWTGRFLSAQGAWGARGGSETNPADFAWTAPPGPFLQLAGVAPGLNETSRRFRGYRLDEDRRPVFLYELDRTGVLVTVEEAVAPRVDPIALVRRFVLSGPPGQVVYVATGNLATHGVRRDNAVSSVVLDQAGRAAFEVEVTW